MLIQNFTELILQYMHLRNYTTIIYLNVCKTIYMTGIKICQTKSIEFSEMLVLRKIHRCWRKRTSPWTNKRFHHKRM